MGLPRRQWRYASSPDCTSFQGNHWIGGRAEARPPTALAVMPMASVEPQLGMEQEARSRSLPLSSFAYTDLFASPLSECEAAGSRDSKSFSGDGRSSRRQFRKGDRSYRCNALITR